MNRFRCHSRSGLLPVWAAVLCAAVLGCGGGGDGPEFGEVEGTVTMDGKPLPDATVVFQPTGEKGSPSMGTTDDEGRYELRYSTDQEGAMLGEHYVTISTAGVKYDEETDEEISVPETVPVQYNKNAQENSEMKKTVEAGGNTFDFKLTSEGEIEQPNQGRSD